jgi:hypothetical protein
MDETSVFVKQTVCLLENVVPLKHLSVFEEIVFKFKKEDGFTLNSPYAEMAPVLFPILLILPDEFTVT